MPTGASAANREEVARMIRSTESKSESCVEVRPVKCYRSIWNANRGTTRCANQHRKQWNIVNPAGWHLKQYVKSVTKTADQYVVENVHSDNGWTCQNEYPVECTGKAPETDLAYIA